MAGGLRDDISEGRSNVGTFLASMLAPEGVAAVRDRADAGRTRLVQGAEARSLLGGLNAVGTPDFNGVRNIDDARGQATLGVKAAATPLYDNGDVARKLQVGAPDAFNAAALQSIIAKAFPAPGKPTEVTKGGKLVDSATGRVIADNPEAPKAPEDPEFLRMLTAYQAMPTNDPRKGSLKQWLDKATQGKTDSEQWTIMTPGQVSSANLPAGGSYQINSKGQIQVITQPKQENPTEGQEKYAYNAGRVADTLKTVKSVLSKDPSAATSWLLDSTDGIPGLDAAGRKFSSDNAQLVRNNLGDAIDAVITLGTGAAYTDKQLQAERNKYMPRPGESPAIIKNKFDSLVSIYSNARTRARAAGRDLPDVTEFAGIYGVKPPGATSGASGAWSGGPVVIQNGWRYDAQTHKPIGPVGQ